MSAKRDAHLKKEQALRAEINELLSQLELQNYSSKSEKAALNQALLTKRQAFAKLRQARPKE